MDFIMKNRGVRKHEHGATSVEFALVSVLFLSVLTAIVGFGHWMFTLEMVADATRTAARLAVVCNMNSSALKTAIQVRVPQLSLATSQVSVQYYPTGCDKTTCQGVTMSITGVTYAPVMPFMSGGVPIPSFKTSLPRESLETVNAAGEQNPVCL